jgi:predicted transcriptional regulator
MQTRQEKADEAAEAKVEAAEAHAHHGHSKADEERRERVLMKLYDHMKGAHYNEVIEAARATLDFLKDG